MDLDIRFTVCHGIIITDSRDLSPKLLLYKWETSSTKADGTNLSVPNLLWDRMRLVVSPTGNEAYSRGQSRRNDEKEVSLAAGHFEVEDHDILGLISFLVPSTVPGEQLPTIPSWFWRGRTVFRQSAADALANRFVPPTRTILYEYFGPYSNRNLPK
jgi:hypothetical protein